MNKGYIILTLVLVSLLTACQKWSGSELLSWNREETEVGTRVPIEFTASSVSPTKAFTETTTANLTTFYVTALKSDNSQFFKNVAFSGTQGGSYTGGWYWPSSGTLSFYAISKSYTQTISSNTITVPGNASTDGDVVRAVRTGVANGTASTALTFSHIYSDLQGIVFTAQSGYTVSVTSLSYQLINTGTYNISTDSWSGLGALGTATAVSSPALSNTGIAKLCVPGTNNCKVTVTYNCTRLGYTETYTRTATVTLPKGQKSTVKGTLGPNPGILDLTVVIDPWEGVESSIIEM